MPVKHEEDGSARRHGSASSIGMGAVDRRRAFEHVLTELERAMTSGRLRTGDRLPAERELADTFGVSRTSVREAVRVLEALGIVRIQRGADGGVTIVDEGAPALTRLIRLQLALNHVSLRNILEMRVLIESSSARELAVLGYKSDDLDDLVVAMSNAGQSDFHLLDESFHEHLVRASNNGLATLVLEGIRGAVGRWIVHVIQTVPDWEHARLQLVEEHRSIVSAIRAADPELAAARVEHHIHYWMDQAIKLQMVTAAFWES
jgi:DNA-binding FadR family transcriptional regulator